MAIFYSRSDRRELECFAPSSCQVFIMMAYTATAAKRNGPACSLHCFSSCAFLPFLQATVCFVLARAFLSLYSKMETDVDLNFFFFFTKNLSPTESNHQTIALHAASEIPPDFNNPPCVPKTVPQPLSISNDFLSPCVSSKLPPLFSTPHLGLLCFPLSTHGCFFVWYLHFQLT